MSATVAPRNGLKDRPMKDDGNRIELMQMGKDGMQAAAIKRLAMA